MRSSSTTTRGVIAGFVGATVLALWFLVVDVVQAAPFRTPGFVAGTIFGVNGSNPGVGLLAVYTALHFLGFVAIGVAVATLLRRTHTAPHPLLGLVLGFLLFDLVFYVGVIVTGVNVVTELGWPWVLIGNLLAGLGLMLYLRETGEEPHVSLRQALREHQTVREGLVAGLIGAGAVMLWFLVLDIVRGQLFFTPAALGSALFFGARGIAEVQITAGTVIGYTTLHVAAFIIVGFVASALAGAAEREPPLLLGLALLFVTFEVLFIGLLAIMATWLLDALRGWTVIVANLIAAVVMGAYLWHEHPKLQEELSHDIEEELVKS